VSQPMLFEQPVKTAIFCPDRVYRYELWRRWSDDGAGYVNFICLNPSKADENTDDPTVKKCVKFAQRWGYDAICITNLFAYRATDPNDMKAFPDPCGFGNTRYLKEVASNAALIVCAWSQHGSFNCRSSVVKRLLRRFDLHYLRMSHAQGEPWHPLYIPDITWPSRWPRELR
jgi:hypothetical protein